MTIMMYGSSDTECDGQIFLSFWTIFCPFTPLTTWKIKILKNWKTPRDIIILHMCTLNDNHMMYGPRDTKCNWQNFLSFWTIFCPFTPLITQKIKILKKWKNLLKISSFYTSVPKIIIICYTLPEMWCVTDLTIFHFGLFFALLKPKKSKFRENEKNARRYHHFTYVY